MTITSCSPTGFLLLLFAGGVIVSQPVRFCHTQRGKIAGLGALKEPYSGNCRHLRKALRGGTFGALQFLTDYKNYKYFKTSRVRDSTQPPLGIAPTGFMIGASLKSKSLMRLLRGTSRGKKSVQGVALVYGSKVLH